MPDRLSSDQVAAALESLSGWSADGADAISKTFKLDDHITAMGFVNRVAMAAEVMKPSPRALHRLQHRRYPAQHTRRRWGDPTRH